MAWVEHTCDYKYISSRYACSDCGHEFDKSELDKLIENEESCPECGEPIEEIIRNEDDDRFDE